MRAYLASIATFALAACHGTGPTPGMTGPSLSASLAASWPAAAPARQVAFSRDGKMAAFSDASGLITLRGTDDWKIQRQLHHSGGATSVGFSSDGRRLYSGGYDGIVREWDLGTGQILRTFHGGSGASWTLDVSPDGKWLAAGNEDSIIRVWPLAGDGAPMQLRGHQRNIWEVRFSPDGRRIASGSFDDSVRLWDSGTGRLLKTMTGHREAVVGLDFSPDGRLIATGADDSTIRYWRTSDRAPLRTVDNGYHVDKVAFSPNGQWLASGGHARGTVAEVWHQVTGGGGDGPSVRVWRVSDGALVGQLPHPEDVIWVQFSRDGHWLVTSGEDNRFYLWRLKPGMLGRR